jgi:hypothetical protein
MCRRFARSPQWYHERPNRDITPFEKFCFNYIPFWLRYHRFNIFRSSDALVTTYGTGDLASQQRVVVESTAKDYIQATAPEKYHHFLVPQFPLGMSSKQLSDSLECFTNQIFRLQASHF